MGFMTVIGVLNDGSENFKKHPEYVGKCVYDAMQVRYHENGKAEHKKRFPMIEMTSLTSKHADEPQLILAWRNDFDRIGYNSNVEDIEHRETLIRIAKQVIEWEEKEIERMRVENKKE